MSNILAGLHLLVVEDEAMVALMVEDILADLGCTAVEVAGTVAKGLAIVAHPDPPLDGAILDVNIGGEKVYPVAEALTARGVPFIFATGYGIAGISEALVATALGLGVAIIALIFYNYFQTRIASLNGLFRIQVAKVIQSISK